MQNMANEKDKAAKDSDILQHLPEAHLQHQMTCGSERDNSQRLSRFCRGSGTELNIHLGNQKPALLKSPDLKFAGQEEEKSGWPRNSWRRDTEAEVREQGINWTGTARSAQSRVRWRGVVDSL
jgi:hypothetical protein